jgi:chromosome partitioning protein
MILTLGNKKGGVGKSTSAVYLASLFARSGRTLIVDADPQGSILSWSEEAGEDFPAAVVQWATRDLAKRVKEVAGDYAHIVIDTGRSATEDDPILRQALMVTDHLVVPFAPSLMDVRELGRVLQMADDLAAIHVVATHLLLTKVRVGTNSARDARAGLATQGLPLLDAQVSLLEAYANVWGTVIRDPGEYEDVLGELMGSRV